MPNASTRTRSSNLTAPPQGVRRNPHTQRTAKQIIDELAGGRKRRANRRAALVPLLVAVTATTVLSAILYHSRQLSGPRLVILGIGGPFMLWTAVRQARDLRTRHTWLRDDTFDRLRADAHRLSQQPGGRVELLLAAAPHFAASAEMRVALSKALDPPVTPAEVATLAATPARRRRETLRRLGSTRGRQVEARWWPRNKTVNKWGATQHDADSILAMLDKIGSLDGRYADLFDRLCELRPVDESVNDLLFATRQAANCKLLDRDGGREILEGLADDWNGPTCELISAASLVLASPRPR
jgi:hypothetical protein